ncbi:MAG TPA: pyridoxal phosphate-dependent aminotransferase [Gemmatimonadaceae bacterium]|jgi:aspartate/methionine/tyrosine aminotransferase
MRYTRTVTAVTESPLVQIATLAESMPGAIKLCYGESDMPTPDFICRAADDAMRAGHTFYTNTAGYTELRAAIANKGRELHGVSYDASEILCTVGATMAMYIAVRTHVGPGDNAIIVSPCYALFDNAVTLSGGEPRPVPLVCDENTFSLDIDRIRARIDDRTRMIIVNSPSNPTGWMISEAEQRALYALAVEHDLVILSDEVYERLTFDVDIAPSFARIADDRDHLIVVNSFSKTYNMTGWRLGWAQASARAVKAMANAAEFITSNSAAMVQQAGIVALRDGESYVRDLRASYASRRDRVVAAFREMPGVSLALPSGGFYAFARVDGLTDSATFALDLLRETGVALAPGSAFGAAGEGCIRLCFAASEPVLADALDRIAGHIGALARVGG